MDINNVSIPKSTGQLDAVKRDPRPGVSSGRGYAAGGGAAGDERERPVAGVSSYGPPRPFRVSRTMSTGSNFSMNFQLFSIFLKFLVFKLKEIDNRIFSCFNFILNLLEALVAVVVANVVAVALLVIGVVVISSNNSSTTTSTNSSSSTTRIITSSRTNISSISSSISSSTSTKTKSSIISSTS